jgi:hypothetical protein
MKFRTATLLWLVCALVACAGTSREPDPALAGSERDPHGCIPTAGYSWCAREQSCVRSWELAEKHGLPATQQAFDTYCTNHQE